MNVKLKITLTNDSEEEFMGIGLVWLLRAIDTCHSIHGAAEQVGLSYVKALKILNRMEANLPKKIIARTRGGNQRGGAELTPYGQTFLKHYDELQNKIKSYANKQFQSFNTKVMS